MHPSAQLFGLVVFSNIPWFLAMPFSINTLSKMDDSRVGIFSFPSAALYGSTLFGAFFIALPAALCASLYRVCIEPFKIYFSSTAPVSIISAFSLAGVAHQARFPIYTSIFAGATEVLFDVFAGPSRMLINGALALDKNAAMKGAALVGIQTLGYIAINYALSKDENKGRA